MVGLLCCTVELELICGQKVGRLEDFMEGMWLICCMLAVELFWSDLLADLVWELDAGSILWSGIPDDRGMPFLSLINDFFRWMVTENGDSLKL